MLYKIRNMSIYIVHLPIRHFRYLIFFLLCSLYGFYVGTLVVSLEKEEMHKNNLKGIGITCEESEDEFMYLWSSPHAAGEVIELLKVSKANGKIDYCLDSRRVDEPDYFHYCLEDDKTGNSLHGLIFGTYEKALMVRWWVQNHSKCTSRMFSLPIRRPGMEVYKDIDGDGMCDWRSLREEDVFYEELLLGSTWLPVDGMYETNSREARVLINGISMNVLFHEGKWVDADDNSIENMGAIKQ